jgi:hypothetical protein
MGMNERGRGHTHTRGMKRENADNIVSPYTGTSYSPEFNKSVVEHYKVTP